MNNIELNQEYYSVQACSDIIIKIIKSSEDPDTANNERIKFVLMRLFATFITTSNITLFKDLLKLLAIFLKKSKQIQENELEEESEFLTEEEIKTQTRFIIYEIYKIINPNKIAGETQIENFISNVIVRGIEAALYYEKRNVSKIFSPKELRILKDNSKSILGQLKAFGTIGFGRGI